MITLQFVAGTDLSSEAIEWFSHGRAYSHVDAVLTDGTLLGARLDGGVAIRPADYLGSEKTLRISLPTTPAQESAFYQFLRAQLGKPYDVIGITDFFDGRDWREPGSWFCSELQAAALESCQVFPYPLPVPEMKITPPDLINLCGVLVKV